MQAAPVPRLRRTVALGVLRALTAALRPVRKQLVALQRFCKRNDLLFINDWEADVAPVVLSQRGPEAFLVSGSDMTIGATVRATGEFDFEKVTKALSLLPPDFVLETLYDIGANIGVICIPAVKRGLARRAVAFEPEPGNYRLMVANIYLNGLEDSIRHYNVALGAADGERLVFELAETNHGDHRIRVSDEAGRFGEGSRRAIQVPSERFDHMVEAIDPARSLFWMDVQGYEGHVLTGASTVVRQGVPLVTELWPYGLRRAGAMDAFMRAVSGYTSFYDLSEADPVPVPIARLEELVGRIGFEGANTDILLR